MIYRDCSNIITILLLLIGLYFPTSLNQNISTNLMFFQYIIIIVIYITLLKKNKKMNFKKFLISILINVILLFCTIRNSMFSNLEEISFGAYIPILAISIMYLLDLKKIKCNYKIDKILLIVNIINTVLNLMIISGNENIMEFIKNFYSASYDNLLLYMFNQNKPVLTFGTHSIAGFYTFILLYLNYLMYKYKHKNLNFLFSLMYLFSLFSLKSTTSYIFFMIGIGIYLKDLNKKRGALIVSTLVVITIAFLINSNEINNLIYNININFTGFKSRFEDSAIFSNNIAYIYNNFFNPIGLGYRQDLYYSDNGYIINLMRGGVVYLILIYYGLYRFIIDNIIDKKIGYFLFFIFTVFEVGYPIIFYRRTVYLLPFIIILINYTITDKSKHKKGVEDESMRINSR